MAQGTTRGVPIDTDPLLANDSDLLVPSQKAIKTYTDTGLSGKVNRSGDSMSGSLLLVANPTAPLEAATKDYVDTLINGIDWKAAANAATVAALPTYNVTGSGQILTGAVNGAIPSVTTDGVTLTATQRVLVKNETSTLTPNNGIYVVTQVGSGSLPFILTRSSDANTSALLAEATISVGAGSTLSNTQWHCNPAAIPVVIGTTYITFAQIGTGVYSFSAPLVDTGGVISIPAATTTVDGYLSSTDWTNFDTAYTNRITSLTTTGTSGAATLIANTLNIPQYAGATVGGSTGNIQYNNGTTFAGSNNLFWDATNNRLGLGTSSPNTICQINLTNTDFVNTNGAGSHIYMTNPSATGQTVVSSFINGALVAKWRTDYVGNISWVAGTSGAHDFYTGGDFGVGSAKLRLFNNGNVQIATSPVGGANADAGYKLDVQGTARLNSNTTFGSTGFWDNTNTRLGINQTTPTSRLHINFNQNSVTQSDANGILLANSTAAIAGTQSISPAIVWQGNGWKTDATAGSQDIRFRADVLPVQGTTNTNGIWRLSTSINGGAYVDRITVTTYGATASFTTYDFQSSSQGRLYSGNIYANSKLVAVEQVEGGGGVPSGTTGYRTTNTGGLIVPKIGSYSTNTVGTKYYGIDNTNGFTLSSFNSAGNLIVNASVDITGITTGANSEAASLIFRTQSSGTAMTEKMRIGGTGNVLIGTQIDGGFKLEVSGTAKVSGNLTTNIATTQIAYSSSGILSGSANLYWDNTNNYLVNRGYYFFEFPLTSGCGLVGRQQGTSNLLFQMGFNAQAQYGGTLGTVSGNQFFVYNFQGAGGAANYLWGFNNSGDNFWGSSSTAYSVKVQQPAVGNIPLAIQGQTSQTARLLTITSTNAGTVGDVMSVFAGGNIAINSATDGGTKLYVNGTVRWGSTSVLQSAGYTTNRGIALQIGGTATYKTTNAGSALTPVVNIAPNGETSGAISLNYDFNNGNGLNFAAGNGTNIIARAGINITNLVNTAGSESGDLIFLTQSGGTAISEKLRITSVGAIAVNGSSNTGTSGQVLTSAGSGAPPTWSTPTAAASEWAITTGFQGFGSVIKGMNLTNPSNIINNSAAVPQAYAYAVAYYLPTAQTITGVKWYQATQGNYTANNYNGIGLYSYSGGTITLVASTTNDGTIWQTASTNTWTSKAFSSTYSAAAGVYYIAYLYNRSAQVTAPNVGYHTDQTTGSAPWDFTNGAKRMFQFAGPNTSLPASLVLSGNSFNTPQGLSFYLY